jgi:predicted transcriptional regulator
MENYSTFLTGMKRSTGRDPSQEKPVKVLMILDNLGPRKIPDLLEASGIDFNSFADALVTLRKTDLITMEGPAGHETVQLTEHGKEIVAVCT